MLITETCVWITTSTESWNIDTLAGNEESLATLGWRGPNFCHAEVIEWYGCQNSRQGNGEYSRLVVRERKPELTRA